MTKRGWILYAGDTLAIATLTLIGFATHGETGLSILPRMGALFFPLMITWFLLAHQFRLLQPEITSTAKQLWRPALAMLFAAPLAAILRALILNTPVIPIFVVVLSATAALGMVLWRIIWIWIIKHT